MKLTALFLLGAAIAAADITSPCCRPDTPAAGAAATELSRDSIYQLDATWTNDEARPLQLASLRGETVVLAMIFTQCEYACPLLVSDLRRLRDALPDVARANTRFVLVTFDTVRDTPAALKAYRTRMDLDERWTLLRGADDDVRLLAMLLGIKYQQDARGQFSHSNVFTILNAEGEIVRQQAGLMGDISEAARTVAAIAGSAGGRGETD